MTEILHSPFGHQHPYEQRPEERFPRHPLAEETFTIGIVTRPPQIIKALTVMSEIDGVAQEALSAKSLGGWRPELEHGVGAEYLERLEKIEQDVWQVQLTAPKFGQKLSYWIEGDGIQTEKFTLIGEVWSTEARSVSINNISEKNDFPKVTRIEYLSNGQKIRRVKLAFKAHHDEGFYGLGERFNALNQRGNIMDIRVYEQYKSQSEKTYMPIPFLLSSNGYGLWVNSTRWMQFDLAASDESEWILEADIGDEELNLHWFTNDDPYEIVGQFARKTGPVVLPPEWAFGLWMSGNEWNSQQRVMKEVQTSLELGIQPAVIVIEAWSDETTFYIWNDAKYEAISGDKSLTYEDFTFPEDGKWSDPKGMIDWLHEQGVKVLLWQVPVFKDAPEPHLQHDADRDYFESQKLGIREADGSLHRLRPFWFRGGYIPDMTNPQAKNWWLNKRAYLLDEMGIDGFKTDGGEHLWGEDVLFADGRTGAEVWNEYPQLYSEAYYEFANSKREAVTFSRAGYTGSQRAPLHWAGDENSTWDAYRHSILAGLSAGISGISFWGWDLAGFSGEIPSAELYLRSTAMATFCPVMQYHSEFNNHQVPNVDRTPWNIQTRTGDERVIPIFREFVKLRQKLMPYIWKEAQYSAQSGQPMMRSLKLIDNKASQYDYFFGRDLLVSPVVEPNAETWSTYLPKGKWRCFWTDEVFDGEQST
ncbi:MAG: TIM-barrel domain-containing protein, partial [Phototrophicaceae bacterium]